MPMCARPLQIIIARQHLLGILLTATFLVAVNDYVFGPSFSSYYSYLITAVTNKNYMTTGMGSISISNATLIQISLIGSQSGILDYITSVYTVRTLLFKVCKS